jgi:hypothetical protein
MLYKAGDGLGGLLKYFTILYNTSEDFTIFDNNCSLWLGNVTIIKNDKKNTYVNFYYAGKKHSIHRLLYHNFIGVS